MSDNDWAEVDAALDKIGVTIAEPPSDELLLARFYQNWMAVSLVTIEDEEAFAFARSYLRMVKETHGR